MNSSWLEIALTIDGELAEAVAEVLTRYIPGGVVIESTAVISNENDEGGNIVGPLRVCGYLPVDEHTEEKRQKIEQTLWYLNAISPLPAPEYHNVHEQDWAQAWKQHYHPISIGQKLIIVPAWMESTNLERIPIRMDPGMAFGTGTHPTTQLCLELIEETLVDITKHRTLHAIDIGCGSGILSVASLKLGSAMGLHIHALGVDIDSQAANVSQENAQLNQVNDNYETGIGSVKEILKGDFSIHQAPLVFANILAPIIIQMFSNGLEEVVAPGGTLILSGILDHQAQDVLIAASQHGLLLSKQKQIADWVALKVEKA